MVRPDLQQYIHKRAAVRKAVRAVRLQDPDKVNQFKHRMNTLAYGEAMMAAARDYGNVCLM